MYQIKVATEHMEVCVVIWCEKAVRKELTLIYFTVYVELSHAAPTGAAQEEKESQF